MVCGLVGYFVLSHDAPGARNPCARAAGSAVPMLAARKFFATGIKKERGLGSGFGWFYDLGVMQKLEQSLWQAGIYRRVSDVLLVMLLCSGRRD